MTKRKINYKNREKFLKKSGKYIFALIAILKISRAAVRIIKQKHAQDGRPHHYGISKHTHVNAHIHEIAI